MPLPDTIRVKLSSEAAEYAALTPVVTRDLPFAELLDQVVSAAGMDESRVREILKRGSLVSGATRFRWTGWESGAAEIGEALGRMPQPEPLREFVAAKCVRVMLTGRGSRLELGREAAAQRRIFRRRSFWQSLMEAAGAPAYVTYHYRDRADHYRATLGPETLERLRRDAALLKFGDLARQVRSAPFERMELVVER
ncbi:MAG: hypothetical protein HY858_08835 [Candidatus Solibacter usitatus]|nr:hypothetical protein [Candidatus Solibacter usitatus]